MRLVFLCLLPFVLPSSPSTSSSSPAPWLSITHSSTSRVSLPSRRGRRRYDPPFGSFLKSNTEKRQLWAVIKAARREGATREQVASRIDSFLRVCLSPVDYAEVQRLRRTGAIANQGIS